jgi:hypothetical protein
MPVWRVRWTRGIQERGMRCQPCLALVRIETLNQGHLVWCLFTEVIPLVRRVVAHAERAPLSVPIDVPRRHEVFLRIERAPVCDGEWVVCDGVSYGTPHIDNPHTTLEQAICVGGRMLPHSSKSCGIRLVNVYSRLEQKGSTTAHG